MRKLILALSLLSSPALANYSYTAGPFAYTSHTGVSYGPASLATGTNFASGNVLDVYQPNPTGSQWTGPYPAVVIIHGGGWDSGVRSSDTAQGQWWASNGYVAFVIDYRLQTPHVKHDSTTDTGCTSGCAAWPAQLIDTLGTFRWVRAHATTYNLDPAAVGCKGDSAGASMCMDAGFYPADVYTGTTSDTINGQNTAYNGNATFIVDEFGPATDYYSYNSTPPNVNTLVTNNTTPSPAIYTPATYFIQGTTDTSVPKASETDPLVQLMEQNCKTYSYQTYIGGHEFSGAAGDTYETQVKAETDAIRFVGQQLTALGYQVNVPAFVALP